MFYSQIGFGRLEADYNIRFCCLCAYDLYNAAYDH